MEYAFRIYGKFPSVYYYFNLAQRGWMATDHVDSHNCIYVTEGGCVTWWQGATQTRVKGLCAVANGFAFCKDIRADNSV